MDDDFSYDPVTAIDEASATGQTAEIFADIRETMQIPLVTSIWRGLAGMDDSLKQTWQLAKPIYASGLPEHALERVTSIATLPVPPALVPGQLHSAGISDGDLEQVLTVVDAYNRSNGMNMVALAALINAPGSDPAQPHAPDVKRIWKSFPPLMAQEDISEEHWSIIRHVNCFGSSGLDAGVATLWRHLAHWPQLLSLVYASLLPLHTDGRIFKATEQVTELTQIEGARMAHLRSLDITLSAQALQTITGYVTTPTQVVRMVTLGHALAKWLRAND